MNQRIGAVAGIAFVVLGFASLGLAPPPPGLDDSVREVVDWYADNTGGIQAMGLMFALTITAATIWFGAVRVHVWAGHDSPPWGPVATVGMAVIAVSWTLIAAVSSAVAFRLDDLDPGIVVFGGTLADMANYVSQLGLALLALGLSAGAREHRSLPSWLVVVGGALAVLALASTAGFAVDAAWVDAAEFASWLPFIVWMVGVSVVLWRAAASSPVGDRPSREAVAAV